MSVVAADVDAVAAYTPPHPLPSPSSSLISVRKISSAYSVVASHRPLLFLSAIWSPQSCSLVATGSDHCIHTLDILNSQRPSYSFKKIDHKSLGHTEWVTTSSTFDNKIYSGGMDGKILQWSKSSKFNSSAGCRQTLILNPHQSSITKVWVDPSTGRIFSSSYEGLVKIESPNNGRILTLGPPRSDSESLDYTVATRIPITDFQVLNGNIFTSTRDGRLHIYDLETEQVLVQPTSSIAAHQGPIVKIITGKNASSTRPTSLPSPFLVMTAGVKDGFVRLFDLRIPASSGRGVAKIQSCEGVGRGVTSICLVPMNSSTGAPETTCFAMTAGRGASISILDLRQLKQSSSSSSSSSSKKWGVNEMDRRQIPQRSSSTTENGAHLCCYSLKAGWGWNPNSHDHAQSNSPFLVSAWGNGSVFVDFLSSSSSSNGNNLQSLLSLEVDKWTESIIPQEENSSERNDQYQSHGGLLKNAVRSIRLLRDSIVGCGDDGAIVVWPRK